MRYFFENGRTVLEITKKEYDALNINPHDHSMRKWTYPCLTNRDFITNPTTE